MNWERFLPEEFTPAAILSVIFHPLLTPAPAGVLILRLGGVQLRDAILWIVLCALVVILPISIYIAVMKIHWGQATSVRENRHQLYIIGIGLTALLLGVLHYLDAPKLLLACIYSGILSGFMGFALNILNKVSLHTGVSTGISVVLLNLDLAIGAYACVLTVLVGLARFRMKRHTTDELVTAALISTFSVMIVFYIDIIIEKFSF